ncbi:hypothetical protein ACFFHH_15080 [Cytobacillus solani]|uniref:hypothetical protein n=1 Tax=Cytobacillus solani TaxID=1637975 RepID=UPI0006AB7DA8|nr:hypothetical protein [Cytobacillus solani]
MITCPYCATELKIMVSGPYIDHALCNLCQIVLGPESEHGMYVENGQRANKKRLTIVTVDLAKKPLPELMKLHTADLIHLLRLMREERATQYNLLRIFNKAVSNGETQFADQAAEQGGEYEHTTRLCWKIENILNERMGYFPEKIVDNFIIRYEERCQEQAKKVMKIRKQPIQKTEKIAPK